MVIMEVDVGFSKLRESEETVGVIGCWEGIDERYLGPRCCELTAQRRFSAANGR